MDSFNQSLFYQENNIYEDSDYDLYKGLEKLKYSKVNLFYRNFIGFNHSCLKERKIYDIYWEILSLKNATEEERLFILEYQMILIGLLKYLEKSLYYISQ